MPFDFLPTGVATGVSGSIMGAQTVVSILTGGHYVVPIGTYYAYALGAAVKLQVQDSGSVWRDVSAVTIGGMLISDGTNVRFVNGGVGTQTVTLVKIG